MIDQFLQYLMTDDDAFFVVIGLLYNSICISIGYFFRDFLYQISFHTVSDVNQDSDNNHSDN